MADQKSTAMWSGLGISIGAGLGMLIGLIGWGGDGIALGLTFGAGAGLVVGAAADSQRRN